MQKRTNILPVIFGNLSIIKISILTALVIIFFQLTSLLVVYDYIKLDQYTAFVAVCFLLTGIFIQGRKINVPGTTKNIQDTIPVTTLSAPHQELLTLLTTRELQTLKLVYEGKTNKEIAALHYVEISTVKTHINNIYTKLSVSNRKEARAKYATIRDLLSLEQ